MTADQRHDPVSATIPPYYPDTPIARQSWSRYHDLVTVMDGQVGEILAELEADGLAEETVVFFYGDHGRGLPRAKRWAYDSGTAGAADRAVARDKLKPGRSRDDLVRLSRTSRRRY